MNKRFIFVLIVITLIWNLCPQPASSSDGIKGKSPKIVFARESNNFGKVSEGEVLSYSFKFINKGKSILKIENITTSCGCTAASFGEKSEYARNESGEIKVTFNTEGRSGKQEKVIIVHTNDPVHPHKVLKVKCDIS